MRVVILIAAAMMLLEASAGYAVGAVVGHFDEQVFGRVATALDQAAGH